MHPPARLVEFPFANSAEAILPLTRGSSVPRRSFHVINHKDLDSPLRRLQAQPRLLLDCSEKVGSRIGLPGVRIAGSVNSRLKLYDPLRSVLSKTGEPSKLDKILINPSSVVFSVNVTCPGPVQLM